jgi:hypothetical protein
MRQTLLSNLNDHFQHGGHAPRGDIQAHRQLHPSQHLIRAIEIENARPAESEEDCFNEDEFWDWKKSGNISIAER